MAKAEFNKKVLFNRKLKFKGKKLVKCYIWSVRRLRAVGIVTGYRLDGPGIKSQWEARFSAPVHTGPGAHPAFCTMGTRFSQGQRAAGA